jgi:two-component system sensor histidine kinase/response regulator
MDQQAPAPRQIRESLKADDRKLAERLAHTVKGVAGSLGAPEVQQAGGALEKAISGNAPTAAIQESLARLETILNGFVARLRAALPGEAPTPTTSAATLTPEQLKSFVTKMTAHLNNFDPAAGDLFNELRDSLRSFFGSEAFDTFEKQLGGFAFADALVTLQQAAKLKGLSES